MTGRVAKESEPRTVAEGTGAEDRPKLRYALLRPARDACVAFGLFVLVSLALSSGPTSASPHRLLNPSLASTSLSEPAVATPGGQQIFNVAAKRSTIGESAAYRQTDTAAAWLLLSLAFSLLAALNMALVRHLRQAYANPRKRA
jgi:hypothetical protein